MIGLWRAASGGERFCFVLVAFLVALCTLGGGGSRADVLSLPIVYLAAVLVIAAGVLATGREGLTRVRIPLILLGCLAAAMAIQLVPLPPALWRALPGRAALVPALDLAGVGQVWRPLSLTPDLTLYALVSVLPPLAVLLVAPLAGRLTPMIVPLLLLACGATALVGLLQAAGTLGSFYRVTNAGTPVGLFANRNHQAAMLVCALPMLAAWAAWPATGHAGGRVRLWLASGAGAALLPLLLVTGSRGGLIFGVLGVIGALAVLWRSLPRDRGAPRGVKPLILAGVGALVLLPMVGAVWFARDVAFHRLADEAGGADARSVYLGLNLRIGRDFLPWGSGYGSFDPVFRRYEPAEALGPTYLNHAHNDLLELLIEGGPVPLLLAAMFLAWVLRRGLVAWRRGLGPHMSPARAASVALIVLLAWSLVDYPLRTPLLAVVAALCCVLLTSVEEGSRRSRLGKDGPLV